MLLIADTLKSVAQYAKEDEAAFAEKVSEILTLKQSGEIKTQKKQLVKLNKRAAEIGILFKKIYEDNALGKLPDSRFADLAAEYEREQEQLERDISKLQTAVDSFNDSTERAEKFMKMIRQYRDFDEITVPMLHEFVEKIIVHERDVKYRQDAHQKIEIHLNFIGEFPLPDEPEPTLTPEEEEEQRKRAARSEYLRQQYHKRKANGKQKEYTDRYEERRKARYAERKAAYYAEGAVLGTSVVMPFISSAN